MRLIHLLALLIFVTTSQTAWAGLDDEMAGMISDMSNYTAPGAYKTQRRGVISGGSYTARNPIMNAQLLSATPPGFNAGCGGIDMFGGSFSFISADRFISLMRSVASNAAGYAFKTALGSMCDLCNKTIEGLRQTTTALNQFSMNSCQTAQGIVTDTAAALQGKLSKNNSMLAQQFGGIGDTFQSMFTGDPSKDAQQSAPEQTEKKITGNLVWRAMKKDNIEDWFAHGDNNLLEAMMSATGTLIVRKSESGPDNKGSSNPVDRVMPTLTIRDLIHGGNHIVMLECASRDYSTNGCLDVQTKTVQLKGLSQRIEEVLVGPTGGGGVVRKMARLDGEATVAEKNFLVALPDSYGALLRQLTTLSETAAVQFVYDTSDYVALDMAREIMTDAGRAVAAANAQSDHAYAKELSDRIQDSIASIQQEATSLQAKNAQDPLTRYNALIPNLRARQYEQMDMPTRTVAGR